MFIPMIMTTRAWRVIDVKKFSCCTLIEVPSTQNYCGRSLINLSSPLFDYRKLPN